MRSVLTVSLILVSSVVAGLARADSSSPRRPLVTVADSSSPRRPLVTVADSSSPRRPLVTVA